MQIQTGSVLCKYSQDVCYANSYYANVLGGTFISTFLRGENILTLEFTHYKLQPLHGDYLPRVTTNYKLHRAFARALTQCNRHYYKIIPPRESRRVNSA